MEKIPFDCLTEILNFIGFPAYVKLLHTNHYLNNRLTDQEILRKIFKLEKNEDPILHLKGKYKYFVFTEVPICLFVGKQYINTDFNKFTLTNKYDFKKSFGALSQLLINFGISIQPKTDIAKIGQHSGIGKNIGLIIHPICNFASKKVSKWSIAIWDSCEYLGTKCIKGDENLVIKVDCDIKNRKIIFDINGLKITISTKFKGKKLYPCYKIYGKFDIGKFTLDK